MAGKKRPSSSIEEPETEMEGPNEPQKEAQSMKPMERRKKRKATDKERHHRDSKSKGGKEEPKKENDAPLPSFSSMPGLHIGVFNDFSSPDASVRETAAEALAKELIEVQRVYERIGGDREKGEEEEEGVAQLEAAEKDDGLENCAPSLRYAIRRLIWGVSSPRECSRQGFALGFAIVVGSIPSIKVEPLLKLIDKSLEVSSGMKGQEAKDCFLGRLFAYGSIARSGRLTAEWNHDNNTNAVKDFVSHVLSLAEKKRYLREPAVSVILDMVEKLPLEALPNQVLEALGKHDWFQKASNNGDPDLLFLALKLQERVSIGSEFCGKLLPYPFSSDNLFARDHLLYLAPCFKESTFCHPRIHSLWHLLVTILIPEMQSRDEDAATYPNSSKKHKKSRKSGSCEEITKNIRCFWEVVIEESLLLSSHERKHLALHVLLLLLPRLPISCVPIVLSYKLVHCLMDILSDKASWLYDTAQHFLKEIINWIGNDNDRCVSVIVALQKHSNGRFDYITKTQTIKGLIAKFNNGQGCLLFVHNLMSLFVDEGALTDEPSDQSQTTDENSEIGSLEDKDTAGASANPDLLKSWVINTMPRVLKNLKLDSSAKSLADTENFKFKEEKFRVQAESMKFLAVQGLFSASLGTEVTSFELQEKFKWPKAAISSSLCRMCIDQLQLLLEDAQRGEVSDAVSNGRERTDLGSYFMCFLKTLCNIPSVSLYRKLSDEDEKAFKKLQEMESRLLLEERKFAFGIEANKLHALRYVLIQLVLQVLLCPGDFSEAAMELVICCKKAFPAAVHDDSSSEEDKFDDNDTPEMIDVLAETFLSLLPHSSGPMCFAIEQVFRLYCDDLTVDGLLRMLRVVRKDLKPLRHQTASSDEDDDDDDEEDDDFLGIEDPDENDEGKLAEGGDANVHADDSEGMLVAEATGEEVTKEDEVDSEGMLGAEASDEEVVQTDKDNSASDDSDGDMDDDEAMFKKDESFAKILKERNLSGKDSALSQLQIFKSRVLSLLEIYLQKNPGKSQVLLIYSYLVRAFVKYHNAKESQIRQLGMRIRGILQKVFKAKDFPKGDDIQLASLEPLLEKSLRSASRSPHKEVSSLAQASAFWILKVIQSRNFEISELERVIKIFHYILDDFFQSKKCRLKSGFVKEVIRRYPWLGLELFGFLLEKCGRAKSEFRRIEALEVVDCVIKSWIPATKGEETSSKSSSKLLKKNLPALCDLIQVLLSSLPHKQSRRAEVRRFCSRALQAISALSLRKQFLKFLKPEVYSLCESQLGDAFLLLKTPSQ
ncbi:DNA polymerase V-like isoform X1 [Iris pallida]|uniref:DNA polymerase V-like isoform X1 n=1 Tax=Iris pallida TaxID=29817 RepID=A0AAX6FTZ2_IRIPA|nr:DNA polymerase V-like isoform X1 [Iris pallida]